MNSRLFDPALEVGFCGSLGASWIIFTAVPSAVTGTNGNALAPYRTCVR